MGRYDLAQYREAARLQQAHPAWLVLYGPHSRHFWAYPAFDVPRGTIASATSPGDLVVLMRQLEITATTSRPPAGQPHIPRLESDR
jgi:hypothetical protein